MTEILLPHTLRCEDRHRLVLTGITNVERFDEDLVAAETASCRLLIRGAELHVEVLSLENGDLTLTGRIDGLDYEDAAPKGSVLSRLFR